MNYRIAVTNIASNERKFISKELTDEQYETWVNRLYIAENGYMITRIELAFSQVRNYVEKNTNTNVKTR
tara:strand:- start:2900 stop:3106 length:207 start_codon:yes stop_codon:yes gene_type:complete